MRPFVRIRPDVRLLGSLALAVLIPASRARADMPSFGHHGPHHIVRQHLVRQDITLDWGPFAERVTQRRSARAGDMIGPADTALAHLNVSLPDYAYDQIARASSGALLALLNPDLPVGAAPAGRQIWVPPTRPLAASRTEWPIQQIGMLHPWYEAFVVTLGGSTLERIPVGSTPPFYNESTTPLDFRGTRLYLVPFEQAAGLLASATDGSLSVSVLESVRGTLRVDIDSSAFVDDADPTRRVVTHLRLAGTPRGRPLLEETGVDRFDDHDKPLSPPKPLPPPTQGGTVVTPALVLAGITLLVIASLLRRKGRAGPPPA